MAERPVAADAWRLRKAKTLVKLLALARGHRLHREALVAVLWPDRDGASATNNLHQTLYVARRALAGTSGALCSLRDDVVLLSDGPMPWLDTEAFEAACRRAHQTRDPEDYRAAAELYRGDLLPEDRFEDWSEGPREALRERHLGLLLEYADVLSDEGEHTQAVDIASVVTTADPFHEGAHRTLMTAMAASGRRYEALAVFDRLREALATEYAADPEPATRRLYRDLLTHGGAEPQTPPPTGDRGDRPGRHPRAVPPAGGRQGEPAAGADVLRRPPARTRRDQPGPRPHQTAHPDRPRRRRQDQAGLRGRGQAGRQLSRRRPRGRAGVAVAFRAGAPGGRVGAGCAAARDRAGRGCAGPAAGRAAAAAGPGQLRASPGRVRPPRRRPAARAARTSSSWPPAASRCGWGAR